MPPRTTALKMQSIFCRTIGTTPTGIFMKQPMQIIAANRAVKVVFNRFLFIIVGIYHSLFVL